MRLAASFAVGLLFGVGLLISGMSDPAKVLNFFDVFGTWDPSLAFVMAGAVAVVGVGYRLVWRRSRPLFEPRFDVPSVTALDGRLFGGAAIFGIGWGLSGFCPGPFVAAIPLAEPGTLAFLPGMVAGMWAAKIWISRRYVAGLAAEKS